ncbi:MAG: RNA polymerase sigma factor [Bacteroidetes bacterium]|jgi:RNA polymerase sigma factor (sigma-70 family)|nr:RNA polymerase sigma factor [Bacteroidota bacterium]MBT3748630.1 RNA polymerase sigma factor [Bacteroidota bacterium]MBT4399815.1 RNA polymerase sigma factor [Bacteroidota bacterium]MBT4410282.1 RNA polymerase sigma factor [Bacteroidota bacterium]MBT5426540.1 RNA polymerase sigma factor [Bacteroidota bacterium]
MTEREKHQVEETYQQEKGRLLGFIRNRIPDETEAEDLMQDVFLRLILNVTGIQTIDNITAWIYSVTRNRIVDFFRKKRPDSLEEQDVYNGEDNQSTTLINLLPSLGMNPDDKMMADAIWDQIQEALDELPDEQREVFEYHEFENLSFKEIAEKTGVNKNTLLARKRYAILFLRERLNELYKQINE